MSKNILVISSSMRKGGNSDKLADSFISGATQSGNAVEKVYLAGKTINFCKGCLACQKTQKCVINDDAVEIAEKMRKADVIVYCTPVYYYSLCGQLKTLLDRANPLYSSDYKFRDIYVLSTAAEDEEHTADRTVDAIQGWVDCFEKAEIKGTVFAGGVNDVGDISGHSSLEKAFEMGKNA